MLWHRNLITYPFGLPFCSLAASLLSYRTKAMRPRRSLPGIKIAKPTVQVIKSRRLCIEALRFIWLLFQHQLKGEERRPSKPGQGFEKQTIMAEQKKGRKVDQLFQSTESNSLEATKDMDTFKKAPGQVGLHAPHNIDAVRRAKAEDRVDTGKRVFGGVSAPKVADQTYDCYSPIRKVDPPKKRKEEE